MKTKNLSDEGLAQGPEDDDDLPVPDEEDEGDEEEPEADAECFEPRAMVT